MVFCNYGCSVIEGQSYYVKKNPKNLTLNSDKKTSKEDIKSYKEHNKAIEKKKAELSNYLPPENTKKSRKKRGYNN